MKPPMTISERIQRRGSEIPRDQQIQEIAEQDFAKNLIASLDNGTSTIEQIIELLRETGAQGLPKKYRR